MIGRISLSGALASFALGLSPVLAPGVAGGALLLVVLVLGWATL
jgi:hypothetical protein